MDKISETKKLLKTVRENIEKIAETKVKKEKREVTEIKKEIMQYHDSIMEKNRDFWVKWAVAGRSHWKIEADTWRYRSFNIIKVDLKV